MRLGMCLSNVGGGVARLKWVPVVSKTYRIER